MRPSGPAVVTATVAGVTNVAVVLALMVRADYPTLASGLTVATLAVTGFVLGFSVMLVSVHTRLVSPAVGFTSVLVGTSVLELTTPMPEWGELNGYVIVDGPTHVSAYANTWYVWLSLALVAGVVEFGLRRGYAVADDSLRNLPDLPLSRLAVALTVGTTASVLGLATARLVLRSGIRPPAAAGIVLVLAAVVTAVPLFALLTRGVLLPTVLFALAVPYSLAIDVFATIDSPVHIFLFGPYALVLAAVWGLEAWVRKRVHGFDGGRFRVER